MLSVWVPKKPELSVTTKREMQSEKSLRRTYVVLYVRTAYLYYMSHIIICQKMMARQFALIVSLCLLSNIADIATAASSVYTSRKRSLASPSLAFSSTKRRTKNVLATQDSIDICAPASSSACAVCNPRGGAGGAGGGGGAGYKSTSAVVEGLKNALASGLAAACCKIILAPFDTVKTVQQQFKGRQALTLYQAFHTVLARPGGILNLYAGLDVAVIGSMPSVGLYFGVYSYSKRTIGPFLEKQCKALKLNLPQNTLRTLTIATSAALGNTVASFSRVPYEVVKQKLQAGDYTSTLQAMTQMMFHSPSPVRAFFPMGGITSQMVRDIPYAVFTLLSYEWIREAWVQPTEWRHQGQPVSAWRNMVCGGVAGGIGSYLTNPMDVVKTRLQTEPSAVLDVSTKCGGNSGRIVQCAQQIWNDEGPMAFWKGSVPRLMHKVPANAMFFVCYEVFRRILQV